MHIWVTLCVLVCVCGGGSDKNWDGGADRRNERQAEGGLRALGGEGKSLIIWVPGLFSSTLWTGVEWASSLPSSHPISLKGRRADGNSRLGRADWDITQSCWENKYLVECQGTVKHQPHPLNRVHPSSQVQRSFYSSSRFGTWQYLQDPWGGFVPQAWLASQLFPNTHSGPKPHTAQHSHCPVLCISVPELPEQSTTQWGVNNTHLFSHSSAG